jgi:hypothetical protein
MKRNLLLLATIFLFNACGNVDPTEEDQYGNGKFLSEVVPLDEFNSEFDDYNSNLPANRYGQTHLVFSSKRDKKDFLNLVYFSAQFEYNKRLSLVKTTKAINLSYVGEFSAADNLAWKANGNFNVYGPKTLSFQYDLLTQSNANDFLLFYADDSEGNMEIKYLIKNDPGGPYKFDLLNSPKDDGYPSFSRFGDKIYFSSNRDGNFDIYELSIPRKENEAVTLESLVHPKQYTLRKVEELSSPSDDKCPYFQDNMMVFVSDRPGGKGGQDIYYARFENGKWSAPVNAGDRINTAHNEYRPIIPDLNHFSYRLMLFSSDRPGGKGGYDLYMTGLTEKW